MAHSFLYKYLRLFICLLMYYDISSKLVGGNTYDNTSYFCIAEAIANKIESVIAFADPFINKEMQYELFKNKRI
jgi:hypothetical protein